MGSNAKVTDKESALRTQLSELNIRARWYATQIWHVPFAYVGFSFIALAQLAKNAPDVLPWASLVTGAFGILVIIHMISIQNGVKRSVQNIMEVEEALSLTPTVKYLPKTHFVPLVSIAMITTITYFVLFFILILQCNTGKTC